MYLVSSSQVDCLGFFLKVIHQLFSTLAISEVSLPFVLWLSHV